MKKIIWTLNYVLLNKVKFKIAFIIFIFHQTKHIWRKVFDGRPNLFLFVYEFFVCFSTYIVIKIRNKVFNDSPLTRKFFFIENVSRLVKTGLFFYSIHFFVATWKMALGTWITGLKSFIASTPGLVPRSWNQQHVSLVFS